MLRNLLRNKHYLLTYNYVPDMVNKRAPHREAHIAYAKAFESKGLLLGGALQNPVDSGVLLFDSDETSVKTYAENDPYMKNGLITSYSVREIMLAFGSIKPN
jgi:uncharacterized protein YciI